MPGPVSKVRDAALGAVADALNVEAVAIGDVRDAFANLDDMLARIGESDMLTAARDRLKDALQFVHEHVAPQK